MFRGHAKETAKDSRTERNGTIKLKTISYIIFQFDKSESTSQRVDESSRRGGDKIKMEIKKHAARGPKETKDGGGQRVGKILGGNDVGGVAAGSGAYIDFGPRTGMSGGRATTLRRAEPSRAEPRERGRGKEREERGNARRFVSSFFSFS